MVKLQCSKCGAEFDSPIDQPELFGHKLPVFCSKCVMEGTGEFLKFLGQLMSTAAEHVEDK